MTQAEKLKRAFYIGVGILWLIIFIIGVIKLG